jgi:hypothetical protein
MLPWTRTSSAGCGLSATGRSRPTRTPPAHQILTASPTFSPASFACFSAGTRHDDGRLAELRHDPGRLLALGRRLLGVLIRPLRLERLQLQQHRAAAAPAQAVHPHRVAELEPLQRVREPLGDEAREHRVADPVFDRHRVLRQPHDRARDPELLRLRRLRPLRLAAALSATCLRRRRHGERDDERQNQLPHELLLSRL